MQDSRFNIIEGKREVVIKDVVTNENIAQFTFTPLSVKCCMFCKFHKDCAVYNLCINYAKECKRYLIGPGYTKEDEIYLQLKKIFDYQLTTSDSRLHR